MSKQRIPPVDPATAIGTNRKNFDILKSAFGFMPNMALAMAQWPAVLDGYMGLSVAPIKGRLGKGLGEELPRTLAETNRCDCCEPESRRFPDVLRLSLQGGHHSNRQPCASLDGYL
jgi:hypothetical protein